LLQQAQSIHGPPLQRLRQEGKQLDRVVRERVDEVAENLEKFILYKQDNI
jgi:hypothetical protein